MDILFKEDYFKNLNINLVWIFFLIGIFFMLFSSITIPRLLVNILKKRNVSPIFIGVFFLSIITSIPEIISIYSFSFKGKEGVKEALSNIWGANFLSITAICILDCFYIRNLFFISTSKSLKRISILVIFFNFVFFIVTLLPENFQYFKISHVNILTIFIILIYLFFLIYLEINFRRKKTKNDSFETEKIYYFKYKKNNILLFALILILILILVISMLFIVSISEKIKKYYNLSSETVGGLIFGSLTSSPEIWSSLSFFQIGLGLAAVGTVLGSHLFNVVAFVSVDFVLEEGLVEIISGEQKIFMFFVLLNSTLLFINIIRPISHKKQDYLLFPFLIVTTFILGWTLILKS